MNLQYSRTSPAYKEALAFTAKLFKAGYLNPAGLTGPANAVEDFHRGTSGMSRGFSGYYIRPHGEAQAQAGVPGRPIQLPVRRERCRRGRRVHVLDRTGGRVGRSPAHPSTRGKRSRHSTG